MNNVEQPVSIRPYHKVVYSIKNNVTGREYIGLTKNIHSRILRHMWLLKTGQHNIEDMQADYDLYGDDFTVSVLEEITSYADRKREYELIESHESFVRGIGYNYKDAGFKKWRGFKNRRSTK